MNSNANSADERTSAAEDSTFAVHALLAYALSLLLILCLGARLQSYALNLGLFVTELAFIALPAGVVLLLHRHAAGTNLFAAPRPKKAYLTAVIGICAAVIAVYKGVVTRKTVLGLDPAGLTLTGSVPLALLLLAPLCEELLFRPVIQNSLSHHWSNRTSVLLTAVLFGLFHLQLLRFAETFVIGLFCGIVFLKTRNLWYPVLLHFICNALGPLLWRSAPELELLLSPIGAAGAAGLALAGCYCLGAGSPAPSGGLRRQLKRAAFGTVESWPAARITPRTLAPLAGGTVLCLAILLGYGHVALLRHLQGQSFPSNYVVSEMDEWTVVSADEIHARSELHIRRFPENREDLILHLPFQDAALKSVHHGTEELSFAQSGRTQYHLPLAEHAAEAGSKSMIVQWSFPLTCLSSNDKHGYRIPLKSLVPSDYFSMRVTVTEQSGYRSGSHLVFSSGTGKPTMNYGTCNSGIE